ncbi:MAG TPA: VCBS repeat-containing protein, partial [Candidatus Eisenbacteria bacterium]
MTGARPQFRHAAAVVRRILMAGACLALAPAVTLPAVAAGADRIPTVRTVFLRYTFDSRSPIGAWESTVPMRKTLAAPGYTTIGPLHVEEVEPTDSGGTRVTSRLTGRPLIRASTIWNGLGRLFEPDPGAFFPIRTSDRPVAAPRAISIRENQYTSRIAAERIWEAARKTAPIERLAAVSNYEVVIWAHFYGVGLPDPGSAEWWIVATSRPEAPRDIGVTSVDWPTGVTPTGACLAPEVTVTNFGDGPASFRVALEVAAPGISDHHAVQTVENLPGDGSRRLRFEPLTTGQAGSGSVSVDILPVNGEAWSDAFADNDLAHREITVVAGGVFRGRPAVYDPESPTDIPPSHSMPVDVDSDGNFELFQLGYRSRLWRSLPTRQWEEITSSAIAALAPWPRYVLTRDWDADGRADILVVYWDAAPVLLRGDGAGGFIDGTSASGLDGAINKAVVADIDLDGDGHRDLIVADTGRKKFLRNDGLGHFTDVSLGAVVFDESKTQSIAVADFDADGDEDFYLSNWDGPGRLYRNDTARFTLLLTLDGLERWGAGFVDLDGDARLDLVDLSTSATRAWRNRNNRQFDEITSTLGPLPRGFDVLGSDLDGDGTHEMVFSTLDGLKLFARDPNGGPAFDDRSNLLVGQKGFGGSNMPILVL